MRILLISPNYTGGKNASYFPLGLAYLGSYLESVGHKVIPVNLNHFERRDGYRVLDTVLDREEIDLAGLGGLTPSYREIRSVISRIREKNSEIPIVLGGGITSSETNLIMQNLKPDYAVVGEGEYVFADLLKALETNLPLDSVRGIWYWKKGIPVGTKPASEIVDLDSLPFPDVEKFGMSTFLDIQSKDIYSYHLVYYDYGKTIPIIASRSCPYQCTFCSHAGMGRYRMRSISKVVDEMVCLAKAYQNPSFAIYDELFSASRERVIEFCNLLLSRNLAVSWLCQLRVDQLDPEVLSLMKEAGCQYISYGFESGSDTILKSMRKGIRSTQIAKCVEMTRQAKLGFQANFLFGDPLESPQTLEASLAFQEKHQLYFTDWSMAIPYPGSALYAEALKKNLIQNRSEFIESLCDLSTYLWQDWINLTAMDDQVFHETYLYLRELNDINHRKRRAAITASDITGRYRSTMIIQCPICGSENDREVFYPTECRNGGGPNMNSAVGVRGVNLLCNDCGRKMHLAAKDIPHVAVIYRQFQSAIRRLVAGKKEVTLLPALDRFKTVFFEDIDLSGLNVTGVLDSRQSRVGQRFMTLCVKKMNRDNIQSAVDSTFVILPWAEAGSAEEMIRAEGGSVVSWNRYFEP